DAGDRRVAVEVVAAEDDRPPQVVAEGEAVICLLEVPLAELGRHLLELLRAVARLARLGEGVVVDVGRVDLHAPLEPRLAERLGQQHRDRVRLLARGAARGPDAKRRLVLAFVEQARDDLVRDDLPGLGVAEEAGDVDQDRVEELGELLAVLAEVVAIRLPVGCADRLHPLLEPAHQRRAPVAGVVEAALVADVLEQLLELRVGRAHGATGAHSSTAGAISVRGRTSSTPPARIAAPGIPKYCDVASSWASTRPPARLTAAVPAAPSIPVPERTIAVHGPRWFPASERSSTSALGRTWWTSSEWSRRIVWCSSTSMCASGGATHTTPGSSGAASTACSTRSFVARPRIAGRTLGASGVRWMMASTDASSSAGRPPRTTWSAPMPPAEPTTATTWIARGSAVGAIRPRQE